jgi:hypothetical protein
MDNLVNLIREWHGIAQFVMILAIAFIFAVASVMVFNAIERFFNQTLPVLIRGWPPYDVDEDEDDDEDDDKDKK